MTQLNDNWRALSIQQPWVDLILTGRKTIEVRNWRNVSQRGNILLHSSSKIDWKTAALLGYENLFGLPLKKIVGVAEVVDVVKLQDETRLSRLTEHWVLHPFYNEPLGLVLKNPTRFSRPIPCNGRLLLFELPEEVKERVSEQLQACGLDPSQDPRKQQR